MSDNFSEQKEFLLSIKREISLLQQQIDFLLRNEKPVGLLDLDVMMNRTHTIYDKMCSVNVGEWGSQEEEDGSQEEEDRSQEIEETNDEEEEPSENEDAYFEEEVEEETIADSPHSERGTTQPKQKDFSMDDLGFILNFTPVVDEEKPVEKKEEKTDFEVEQPETLGERFQQEQEETLGEKLQHRSLRDLQSAIGINDKFLLVNELFGGSMEKYNKSINNLNDLKTLEGALVYLNELRIDLQWNSSNEAYKKLLDLVHRKFD